MSTEKRKKITEALKFILPPVAQDDRWITVKPNGPDSVGRPALIGEGGEIKAGMGGKFNGKKINEIERTFENPRYEKGEYPSQKEGSGASEKKSDVASLTARKSELEKRRKELDDSFSESAPASYYEESNKNRDELEQVSRELREASGEKSDYQKELDRRAQETQAKNDKSEQLKTRLQKIESEGQARRSAFESSVTYLAVPFEHKDEAKAAGARWDANSKKWYMPAGKEVPESLQKYAGFNTNPKDLDAPTLHAKAREYDDTMNEGGYGNNPYRSELDRRGMGRRRMTGDSFALDASSKRHIDANGFMHVSLCHISKECVNPYYGREVPGWEELGLDAEKIYQGYRSGDELAKAFATFNGLPLLFGHHPESAENPQKKHRIGSTGTEAAFDAPYLNNALSITDAEAIEAIERGERIELSSAYRYDPVFKPGEFEGRPYDFIMTNIRGNHVALVEEGRAGSDVAVADEQIKPKPIARFKMGVKELIEKLKAFLHSAENAGAELDPDSLEKGKELISDMNAVFGEKPAEDDELDGLGAELYALIDTIEDRELADKIKAKIEEARMSGGEEEAPASALDEEGGSPLEKEEQAVGQAFEAGKESEKKEEGIAAMDAALIQRRATMNARNHLRALTEAARKVRGLCGEVDPFAFDSAGDIYRYGLKSCGMRVKTRDVSALADMVQMAMDAKNSEFKPVHSAGRTEFSGPFAGLKNIKVEQ